MHVCEPGPNVPSQTSRSTRAPESGVKIPLLFIVSYLAADRVIPVLLVIPQLLPGRIPAASSGAFLGKKAHFSTVIFL